MSGIPFIYYIPKEFFFPAFYPSLGILSKEHRSIMNDWCTEHPDFPIFFYSSQSGNSAVWVREVNCFSMESIHRNKEKWVMTVAFKHFSIIIWSKIGGYLYSSFHCNWVNVFRHVDNIWVSNHPPSSSNGWLLVMGD